MRLSKWFVSYWLDPANLMRTLQSRTRTLSAGSGRVTPVGVLPGIVFTCIDTDWVWAIQELNL